MSKLIKPIMTAQIESDITKQKESKPIKSRTSKKIKSKVSKKIKSTDPNKIKSNMTRPASKMTIPASKMTIPASKMTIPASKMTRPTSNMTRPTFMTKDNKPIRAGGILLYKKVEGKLFFLMIKSERGHEDFGGRTDYCDSNIIETVARETSEESNEVISKDVIIKLIKNKIKKKSGSEAYIPICKYFLYIRESDKDYNPIDFGEYEIHDNIKRDVVWFPFDEWDNSKINYRLQSNYVYNAIVKILSE